MNATVWIVDDDRSIRWVLGHRAVALPLTLLLLLF